DAYRSALQEWTRDRVPLDWATAQNNLGNALLVLSERESGTARLEQAIDAYRSALQEWTRDRVPLNWATAQSNLGNALKTLGERERGTARLEQAVDAYRSALRERTRDRVPLDWARSNSNLAITQVELFKRTGDKAWLAKAQARLAEAREVFIAAQISHYIEWSDKVSALLTSLAEE
ncbi:MAG: hypothetical protein AAF982_04280, partial [Pseudomonadota bacterium]